MHIQFYRFTGNCTNILRSITNGRSSLTLSTQLTDIMGEVLHEYEHDK